MPSENAIPILVALVGGGLVGALGLLLALVLTLRYVSRRRLGVLASVFLLIAAGSCIVGAGAWIYATGLQDEDQLHDIHEPLMMVIARDARTRALLDEIQSVAEPSDQLAAYRDRYDAHTRSIGLLEQATWRFHRVGPWDENPLLHRIHSSLFDLVILQIELQLQASQIR